MPRPDDRQPDEVRALTFERGFTQSAPGSVLAAFGRTRVLCTATYVDGVPSFLQGKGRGWLTAEYAMLPGSTGTRKARERGKMDGRSTEIQRLIGRSLRAVVDFKAMTERTVWVDCDVIEADGGTRTASITGAWVALVDLFHHMDAKRILRAWPLKGQLGAVSVGIVDGEPRCDLEYSEDSRAEVDLNLVMTEAGRFIEIQGTAEGEPYDREQLDAMLRLGEVGIRQIFAAQKEALEA